MAGGSAAGGDTGRGTAGGDTGCGGASGVGVLGGEVVRLRLSALSNLAEYKD